MQSKTCKLLVLLIANALLFACGEVSDDSSTQSTTTVTQPEANAATDASMSPAVGDDQSEQDPPATEEPVQVNNFFYFSYDDSASTASYDLAMFALDNGQTPSASWGRPYEFLNAESFNHFSPNDAGPFSASIGLFEHYDEEQKYTYHFGVNLTGPTTTKELRKNVVLTLLVDVSGSMNSSYANMATDEQGMLSLLQVTKQGLLELEGSLKAGDVINLVTFSSSAKLLLEGWTFDQDINSLISVINALDTEGSTNLNAGIELAYQVANRQFSEEKSNRVIILTDAYANSGVVDVDLISQYTEINELEGIHFSGIGIGSGFQESFLNELTEAGKGSYFSMITPQDASRLFTTGLPSLIDVAVEDVRFKLTYPNELTHIGSASEEQSENKDDVNTTNFSFNTSQFFLESFQADKTLTGDEEFSLEIEYVSDETSETTTETLTFTVADLLDSGHNEIVQAMLVSSLARLISSQLTCEQVQPQLTLATDFPSDKVGVYRDKIEAYCQI